MRSPSSCRGVFVARIKSSFLSSLAANKCRKSYKGRYSVSGNLHVTAVGYQVWYHPVSNLSNQVIFIFMIHQFINTFPPFMRPDLKQGRTREQGIKSQCPSHPMPDALRLEYW